MARKHRGMHAHRLNREPEERRFANAWREQQRGNTLDYLLDEANRGVATASERDDTVAATVIQWLGSPVGQHFLSDLGYVKCDEAQLQKKVANEASRLLQEVVSDVLIPAGVGALHVAINKALNSWKKRKNV
jgi:hypothetical protein